MLNILGLLFLILFIFAILGTYLFKSVKGGDSLNNEYINFSNFAHSFLLVFRMSTGEDWHIIMYDCMNYNSYSFIYFVIYVVLVQYVMVNLFVLVIIREFDDYFYNTDNPLNLYSHEVLIFKEKWY